MSPIIMDELLMLVVKATMLLAAGGVLTVLARRAPASVRHLIWSATLVGLLALPVLTAGLPGWTVPVLPAEQGASQTATSEAVAPAPPIVDPRPGVAVAEAPIVASPSDPAGAPAAVGVTHRSGIHPLILLWIAGTLGVGLWILLGQIGVMRLRRSARRVTDPEWLKETHDLAWILDISRPVALLRGVGTSTPMTWGMIWPTVLLPSEAADWSAERRRMVLLHELAHVKRMDCLTQLVAHLACALFWFHPLAWYAARRLRVERERACDDLVVRTGSSAPDYADHLLHVARSLRAPRAAGMAVAMARPSQLEGRLLAVLDESRRRGDPSPLVRTAAIVGIALLAVPLAVIQPGAASTNETDPGWTERAVDPVSVVGGEPVPAATASQDLHWRGRVARGGTLSVHSMNGAIRAVSEESATARVAGVRGERRSNQSDVRLVAVEHADGVTLCVVPEGARCTAEGIQGREGTMRRGPRPAALTVHVPAGVVLRTHTMNGAIEIEGVGSDVHAMTMNGAIDVTASGNVEAKTMNGAITASMGRTEWRGQLSLETMNGAVSVTLPAEASTEVYASTMAGSIESDFPLEIRRRPASNTARGTIGAGGRSLRVSSMNGAIRILRRGGALPGAVSSAGVSLDVGLGRLSGFEAAMEAFGEAMGALGGEIAEVVGESVAKALASVPETAEMERERRYDDER